MVRYSYTPGDKILSLNEDCVEVETDGMIFEMAVDELFESWLEYQLNEADDEEEAPKVSPAKAAKETAKFGRYMERAEQDEPNSDDQHRNLKKAADAFLAARGYDKNGQPKKSKK